MDGNLKSDEGPYVVERGSIEDNLLFVLRDALIQLGLRDETAVEVAKDLAIGILPLIELAGGDVTKRVDLAEHARLIKCIAERRGYVADKIFPHPWYPSAAGPDGKA